MSDLWDALRFVLRRGAFAADFSTAEKIELLAQMVANLVDEVEILKKYAWSTSGLSREEWQERYRQDRMWLLFSGAGGDPPCAGKYRPYVKNALETAKDLIPDQAKREEEINNLQILT
ncbi:MAG TPA: hypothetical protein VMS17_02105 [Gemmataceae bacterium]|nr:hypothetical protein [Gemmataceae bacterium]